LDVEVLGTTGLTPYVRWGNAPILAWAGLLLLLGLWSRKRVSA
jgi:apolipoprotein N-acyltransferase